MSFTRQFNFFEKDEVKETPSILQRSGSLVHSRGRGLIFVADNEGFIHMIDRSFSVRSWLAFEIGRVTHMKHMKYQNILVTIGEDDTPSSSPVIKIWDLDKSDKNKQDPLCVKTTKVSQGSNPFPVSKFAVLESMSQIAIGLANGQVILIRGDISRDRYTKQKVIHECPEPITGLEFREEGKTVILFIVTTNQIVSCNTTSKEIKQVLDEHGASLGCSTLSEPENDLIVGRDEAIYFYGPEGRGPCFAYEGTKISINWFKNYIIIVSPAREQPSTTGIGNIYSSATTALSELNQVTIFDVNNKFSAFSASFSSGVRAVICEWDGVFVLSGDGKLFRLEEKDTPTKLEILFKQNLYMLAIGLARSQKYDESSIAEIYKKYGDHLYSKTDYDGAMSQYLKTIGKLEPSYVIRKFLDAQRIHNLTSYLQELHTTGLATADHTTLLLNCYTKLKDVAKLDEFIKTDDELRFDVDTAIRVCRQAGYYEHACYLAEKFEEHDTYLKIQIEDVKDYLKALHYIRTCNHLEADKQLKKYGRTLLDQIPDETTSLLIDLCTGQHNVDSSMPPSPAPNTASQGFTLASINGPFKRSNTGGHTKQSSRSRSLSATKLTTYNPPSPSGFVSIFVGHPSQLITFFESVCEKRWNKKIVPSPIESRDSIGKLIVNGKSVPADPSVKLDREEEEKKSVWNTLLELYLIDHLSALSNEVDEIQKQERRAKALVLLKDPEISYDMDHAFVLCQLSSFDDGIVYLYERMQMYSEILQFWMDRDEIGKVLESLRKFGPLHPALYPQTLTYFASSPASLLTNATELMQVLDHIDRENLLSPLQVVQALSRNSVATVGVVKEYISRRIETEKKQCEDDAKLIQSYRAETEKKRKEIEDLQSNARIFQMTKCSSCGGGLDLPAVHYLCRHSFHQRCLNEYEKDCPKCAIDNRMVLEIKRSQEENADKHELFLAQLEDADDGFEVVADYFSRNTMSFTKLVE
ncbi:vacuolar protein sorting-associated protein 11 [Basidiobolus meristosporus CBS 931.73]|uniref:E3 ubiquitin-protein ligase PEP5 n=1 Tax=Basidiobolus meristosporus CBS 931.73 TaxID=1314790 RepID=A0A1Y1Z9A9_9FUNG|nr:vacuolar protein sorting-associated protein 11 [Basidiobolus meristosporus CBS 931.73]|eukprot:ORY06607.1 vacuolar protein sorting-associated protein 11 [Basidiobolus meristosporus CBS 931.73]